jgi:putative DNA primase/helicase
VSENAERCTDLGNARRLVRLHGERLRYCHPWRRWLVYREGRWQTDDTGLVAQLAKATVMTLYTEARDCPGEEARKALAAWAAKSESEPRLRAMVELAKTEPGIPARPEDFDADPSLFSVRNGTLDLRTGTLRPHDPADLITCQAPVAYDPGATCPRWHAFLDRIFGEDRELIGFLQRAVGYSLTGRSDEQVFLLLHGAGANGKTVFVRTLLHLFGDYGRAADFSTFLLRRSEGPRNDLARLAGARLVVASEAGEGQRFDEELLKKVTGGDRIAARYLYSEEFEFTAGFTIWLAANHRPTIRGGDHAIWRRVILVPFGVTIPEEEQDPHLVDRLTEELPGILGWALEGYRAWSARGLGRPPAVQAAVADYRAASDTLAEFLDQRCVLGEGHRATATALWSSYQEWCRAAGERPMSRNAFGERLRDRGLLRVKSHGAIVWHRIGLAGGSSGDSPGDTGTPGESLSGKRSREANKLKLPDSESPRVPASPPPDAGDAWEPPDLQVIGGGGADV